MKKTRTQDMCIMGLFVAVIAILSQIFIPMPYGVPMTLQTFIVPLIGVILGAKRGAIVAGVYIILGAVGVPVFSEFSAGIASIFGPTGGFILAFPPMAFFAGFGAEKGGTKWLVTGITLAVLVEYTFGVAMFMAITGSSFIVSFIACVAPFIPTEIIKAVLVGVIGVKCRRALIKGGLVASSKN